MLEQVRLFQEYHAYLWQHIINTEEYQRFETELLMYGQSVFNPAKAIAEIEALDRPGEPWHDGKAGRDQIG
jgi:DNA-binding transcriptional regulator of glucitol operon